MVNKKPIYPHERGRRFIQATCHSCGYERMLCKCKRWWPGIDSNDCPKCGREYCECEKPVFTELCEFCLIGKPHAMEIHNVAVARMVEIRKREGIKATATVNSGGVQLKLRRVS